MKNCALLPLCALIFSAIAPSGAKAELVRFIQVIKNESPDTRFHLGELEAFQNGVVPDDLGGATGRGLTTSTNDIGNGTLVTYGDGNLLPVVGTMTSLEHGGANKNPNNLLENAGAVWSTANNQATNAQYTLDLGGTFDVTTVRMWPRNDTCCANRWQNLEVNLYGDDPGNPGNPGELIATSDDARLAAPGGNTALELTFNPGSTDIDDIVLTPSVSFFDPLETVVLSSSAGGTPVGVLSALNEFGFPIAGASFALVPGDGATDNASYDIDGVELQVTGDLSAVGEVVHSVRVEAETAESTLEKVITFKVVTDSDIDGLIDAWEMMFGVLGDFATGADKDSDGVLDEDEFLLGLDPSNPDTDDDGSNDGEEIARRTNPLVQDTDMDGLFDGVETNTGEFADAGNTGTDPLNPDTDGDGLLDGVEDGGGVFESVDKTGSDPNKRDTDGDFNSDGAEVAAGLDPNVPNDPVAGLRAGLVNYWCFDDESLEDIAHSQSLGASSVADDGTFAGANGTDGIAFASGLFGGGINLNGATVDNENDGFVEVQRSDDTLFGANATNPGSPSTVTTSMWVQAEGFDTGWQTMISHGEGSQYRIARRGGADVAAYAGGSGDIPGSVTGPSIAVGTGWHHVVGISEGGVSTRLWVDGQLVATGAAPTINDAQGGSLLNLNIGANPNTGANNREWFGDIDDVAQWNRALTEPEVLAIFESGIEELSLKQLLGGSFPSFRITAFSFDEDTGDLSLTWDSKEGDFYRIAYWTVLTAWDGELDDRFPAAAGATSTTRAFNKSDLFGAEDATRLFFRIEKAP